MEKPKTTGVGDGERNAEDRPRGARAGGIQRLMGAALAPPNNEPVLQAELASLGIDPATMRKGADGNNPNAPNAANYDEAKVRVYTLPSLMGTTPPKNAAQWTKRRAELVKLVEDNFIGRMPDAATKVKVDWKVFNNETKVIGGIPATVRTMRGATSMPDGRKGPVIEAEITAPAKPVGKMPAVIDYTFVFQPISADPHPPMAPHRHRPPPSPAVAALKRGWAYVGLLSLQRSGRQRCRPQGRHHRPRQRRQDARSHRMGRAARLGLGREPRRRSPPIGQGDRRHAPRRRGPLALRQVDIGRNRFPTSGSERHWSARPARAAPRSCAALSASSSKSRSERGVPLVRAELPALRRPQDGRRPARGRAHADRARGAAPALHRHGCCASKATAGSIRAATISPPSPRRPAWQVFGRPARPILRSPRWMSGVTSTTLSYRQHSGGRTNVPNWEPFLEWADKAWGADGGKSTSAQSQPVIPANAGSELWRRHSAPEIPAFAGSAAMLIE